jgi:hypothetical protein
VQTVRGLGERRPVVGELFVVDEEVIVADVVFPLVDRRRRRVPARLERAAVAAAERRV